MLGALLERVYCEVVLRSISRKLHEVPLTQKITFLLQIFWGIEASSQISWGTGTNSRET